MNNIEKALSKNAHKRGLEPTSGEWESFNNTFFLAVKKGQFFSDFFRNIACIQNKPKMFMNYISSSNSIGPKEQSCGGSTNVKWAQS